MLGALESVDIAVVDHDLLDVREAVVTVRIVWNAVARGVVIRARLLRTGLQHSSCFLAKTHIVYF